MENQLRLVDATIQEEKALSLAKRIERAKQAYSLEEYLFYAEKNPVKEGSPTYLKRQAEYERNMRHQAQLLLRNAQKARHHLLKEIKKLDR